MNDIVSIRKIRPELSGEVAAEGAAVTCGVDLFLAGNEPSLAANEFFTTGSAQDRGEFILVLLA
jgi:hypothetical protein